MTAAWRGRVGCTRLLVMIDFSLPSDLVELRDRTRAFVRDTVIPFEGDPRAGSHGPNDELCRELKALAADAGLLSPHIDTAYGGLGLGHVGRAVVFEEAGYSPLGNIALNVSAPDEGNAHLLAHAGTEAQKEQWLRPHAAGEIRTCFAMSEPPPGAGSDPGALMTTATPDGDGWVVDGTKKWITGADGAAACIVMARQVDLDGDRPRATMFLVPMDREGIVIAESLDTLDDQFAGGHAVMRFENLRVHADEVLGELGEGFRYAQIRLAPARLTHCMRHLGAARRAHDIATTYAQERQAFGKALGDHEGIGFMLADNEMDLRTSRLLILHTAWMLDQGERCNEESSQAKTVVSEAVWRIVDRCVQILGGTGVSGETVVEQIFRDARPFRIYDGPNEVHRWSLARKITRRGAPVPT